MANSSGEKPKKPETREELMEALEWLANDAITDLYARYSEVKTIQPILQSTIESIRVSKEYFTETYADKILAIVPNSPNDVLEIFEKRLGLLSQSISEYAGKFAVADVKVITSTTKRKVKTNIDKAA